MAIEILEKKLFGSDEPKINVYSRAEYTHIIKTKIVTIDEKTSEEIVNYKYDICINLNDYTSETEANSAITDQPFATERINLEITKEEHDAFQNLVYAKVKKIDKYKDCLNV